GVLGGWMLGEADVARFTAAAPHNTEDRPRLEFEAPHSLYLATSEANARLLLAARSIALPPLAAGQRLNGMALLDVGRCALQARRPDHAQRAAEAALQRGDAPQAA